tara:strand:+ start:891 stop:1268 length:378 start_codon:yes stop_codon:yes gene_type:complete
MKHPYIEKDTGQAIHREVCEDARTGGLLHSNDCVCDQEGTSDSITLTLALARLEHQRGISETNADLWDEERSKRQAAEQALHTRDRVLLDARDVLTRLMLYHSPQPPYVAQVVADIAKIEGLTAT